MSFSRLLIALLLVTSTVPALTAADAADTGEAPLVDAGLDQSVVPGTTVYLDGGGSLDPDGSIDSYHWEIETPHGETIPPRDPDAAMTRFVPDLPGRYLVELTATDDDGNSRSDTLYVDVGGAVDTGSPDDESADEANPPPDAGRPAQVIDEPVAPLARGVQNQAPFGQILGPDSVRAGSSARYLLETSDTDGTVTDYQWLPASHRSASSGIIDPQQTTQTYQFDVEPGSTVQLPAVLVDDDGASSRVVKTVSVTNNPPNAMIQGRSTVTVGSVHEYEVVASDPDGPVTSYSWAATSSAVERVQTGGLVSGGGTDAARTAIFRFTSIPEDDATASLGATVGDEHGGVTTAEKGVTVVSNGTIRTDNPVKQTTPNVLQLKASQSGRSRISFEKDDAQPGRIVFTAVATDNDSEQLTFEWEFGKLGNAGTVETGDEMVSEVSYVFDRDLVDTSTGEEITLTVTDSNGNSRSVTKTLDFVVNAGGQQTQTGLDATVVQDRLVRGSLDIATKNPGNPPSYITVFFGDGTQKQVARMEQSEQTRATYQFDHRYQTAGEFQIQADHEKSIKYTTVSVGSRTYVEWVYEHKVTENTKTVAVERPGPDWERDGVDHVSYKQTGVQTERTRIVDGETIVPGADWNRIGTETEYHTKQRTERATESPGSGWELSERNVDERTVFDGWETRTVPSKWMADDSWDYVGKVARTTTATETTESPTKPSGEGWERGAKTGDSVITGYTTEWVTSRYLIDDDWEYVRSDRYFSGYRTSTSCVDRISFRDRSYCIEERTTQSPTYDTRYKYRVPTYSTEYKWKRTVEETTYDSEYRVETYSTVAVHEYMKTEQVATKYAKWEKPEYNETVVYNWEKTETTWERATSLSEPSGEIRNKERHIRECDNQRSKKPAVCRNSEP